MYKGLNFSCKISSNIKYHNIELLKIFVLYIKNVL